MGRTLYKAKFLLNPDFQILEDAALLVEGSKISSTGKASTFRVTPDDKIVDLGNALIAPGLVNTHCHLELTHLHETFERPEKFTDWLYTVREKRNSSGEDTLSEAVSRGLDLSIQGGVTTIGDLRNFGKDLRQFIDYPIRKVFFAEVIGFPVESAQKVFEEKKAQVESVLGDPLISGGFAPHSPYGVSIPLYQMLYACARENNWPMTTHLAEDQAEVEFVMQGTGSFKSFLQSIERYDNKWVGVAMSPMQYLAFIGVLKNMVAVHCNYLEAGDLEALKIAKATVAFCPRSHFYFGRSNHPIEQYLNAGLNVCLGTDSLASNFSLSLLDDMKFMREHFPSIDSKSIFKMGTINGAVSLKLEKKTGSLEIGKEADFIAISLPSSAKNALEAALSKDSKVDLTVVAGKILHDPKKLV